MSTELWGSGHARAILESIGKEGKLIGIDKDEQSIACAKENLKDYINQCVFVHGDFRDMSNILESISVKKVDSILLDLGISSFQLDNPKRGFSLRFDGPLDMRMDQKEQVSAYDLVNSLSENELADILRYYGQERWSRRIACKLVERRNTAPIETTQELCEIVFRSMPFNKKGRGHKIHPATRTFQAIRIAVNRELEALEAALDQCVDLLNVNGRIGIISFHSLEDRIVKTKFKDYEQTEKVRILTKKPITPSETETHQNPRSRSAKFRVAERV